MDNGEWVYGYYCEAEMFDHAGTEYFIIEYSCDGKQHHVSPSSIGQYTGLTDKNGVKIFEHDICKDGLGMVFTVEWEDANARFLGRTVEYERRSVYFGREPRVEVIGNNHDNPELLEVRASE